VTEAEAPTTAPRPREADAGRTVATARPATPAAVAPSRPSLRRPLIAAGLTLAISAAALIFGYERMRQSADDEAAKLAPARSVKPAAASGSAAARGARKPPAGAPSGAVQSP
jgi:hypothetical protein